MKHSLGDSALEIFNDRSPFCHWTKNFLFAQFLLGYILQSKTAETNRMKFTFDEKMIISENQTYEKQSKNGFSYI